MLPSAYVVTIHMGGMKIHNFFGLKSFYLAMEANGFYRENEEKESPFEKPPPSGYQCNDVCKHII